jgi:hypothetical protein
LDASGRAEARAFLQDHGPHIAAVCYRLDPRGEGVLMIGLDRDALAKRIVREELGREVPESFGQVDHVGCARSLLRRADLNAAKRFRANAQRKNLP